MKYEISEICLFVGWIFGFMFTGFAFNHSEHYVMLLDIATVFFGIGFIGIGLKFKRC